MRFTFRNQALNPITKITKNIKKREISLSHIWLCAKTPRGASLSLDKNMFFIDSRLESE